MSGSYVRYCFYFSKCSPIVESLSFSWSDCCTRWDPPPPPWSLCTVVQGEVMERQEIGKRRKRIYSRIIYEGGGWRQRKRIQTEGKKKERMVVKSDFGRHSCDCAGKRKRIFLKTFLFERQKTSYFLVATFPP